MKYDRNSTSNNFFQIYGEEVEYADDVFGGGPPGPPPMGVIRRSSKKMKSTSGDSSSTSPERNRRDDVAIDVEVERGGSGAGLSCGSTGALGGNYEDNTNFQQSANTVSNIQQMHQINMKEQRMERQPLSQDHWHHKTHSPVSTTHASVIGTGLHASGRVYSGGRYRISEAPKFANSRTHKTEPPSPILKYLKVKVSNVKECKYCVTVASELNRRMVMMSSYCVNHMLLCVY